MGILQRGMDRGAVITVQTERFEAARKNRGFVFLFDILAAAILDRQNLAVEIGAVGVLHIAGHGDPRFFAGGVFLRVGHIPRFGQCGHAKAQGHGPCHRRCGQLSCKLA